MLHGEHTAIGMPDDDRRRITPLRHPGGGIAVVGNRLMRELKRRPLGGPAVTDGKDIVPTPVEGQTGKAKPGERGRQKAGRTGVEIHRVAVKQQHSPDDRRCRIGKMPGTVEWERIGFDGDEFCAHSWLSSAT